MKINFEEILDLEKISNYYLNNYSSEFKEELEKLNLIRTETFNVLKDEEN